MHGRLLATIIFSCLLTAGVGGLTVILGSQPDSVSLASHKLNLSASDIGIGSFEVWQSSPGSKGNIISATLEIYDTGSTGPELDDPTHYKANTWTSTKIILVRANGERLVATPAPVRFEEAGVACNTDPEHLYFAAIYRARVTLAGSAERLLENEPIRGTLIIQGGDQVLEIPLPETQAKLNP